MCPAAKTDWSCGPSGVSPQVVCVLGTQWGDEGKGKLVDFLCRGADHCCRFNGGDNAGHQLVVDGQKRSFHVLPCGILHPHATAILGNGVVLHLKQLIKEIRGLADSVVSRVYISSRAHLLFDLHRAIDGIEERRKAAGGGGALGTTLRGIGPCYSTKVSRSGIRAGDLLDWKTFESSYRRLASELERQFGDLGVDTEDELRRHRVYAQLLSRSITDTCSLLHIALGRGERLLLEGANAALLDIDMGTYPFVTSSNTTAANACLGSGLPPRQLDMVVGVVKAYCTRVGGGPMITELTDAIGDRLRSQGGEYGVTTGRPRRCGWLDIPMLLHAHRINGFHGLCLTKVDVLTGIDTLKLCVAYKNKETGKQYDAFFYPLTQAEFRNVVPVYEEFNGWTEDLSACKQFDQLPPNARGYIQRIQELLGVPFWWIGVGADRDAMILNY
ncbi:adenylosuccinate synthetase [Cyclospora cayetanensis]|uniref:Adenylosuccinate synthetase n=1 Tax=Cyclospora cayetanensis TaxID=88456 RepID=A0A6P6S201_9EIME|nr:adenylosuccinate synthetase [Cyclospora cayetanensis]